jgi:hypothetical protein
MRTTLVIDDALFKALKKKAAESGSTVSSLMNRAIELLLHEQPKPKRKFKLPRFGDPNKKIHLTPAQIAEIWMNDGGV